MSSPNFQTKTNHVQRTVFDYGHVVIENKQEGVSREMEKLDALLSAAPVGLFPFPLPFRVKVSMRPFKALWLRTKRNYDNLLHLKMS